jgi:hypothetical protein
VHAAGQVGLLHPSVERAGLGADRQRIEERLRRARIQAQHGVDERGDLQRAHLVVAREARAVDLHEALERHAELRQRLRRGGATALARALARDRVPHRQEQLIRAGIVRVRVDRHERVDERRLQARDLDALPVLGRALAPPAVAHGDAVRAQTADERVAEELHRIRHREARRPARHVLGNRTFDAQRAAPHLHAHVELLLRAHRLHRDLRREAVMARVNLDLGRRSRLRRAHHDRDAARVRAEAAGQRAELFPALLLGRPRGSRRGHLKVAFVEHERAVDRAHAVPFRVGGDPGDEAVDLALRVPVEQRIARRVHGDVALHAIAGARRGRVEHGLEAPVRSQERQRGDAGHELHVRRRPQRAIGADRDEIAAHAELAHVDRDADLARMQAAFRDLERALLARADVALDARLECGV